jgi:hypothetical protein
MKKKLIPLLLLVLILFSCSSDKSYDDIDYLIGVWKPIKIEHVTDDAPRTTTILEECERNSRYQFNADGTISQWNVYSLNDLNQCYIETELVSGSWVRTNDPSNFRDTFFELTLMNNNTQETFVANDFYDVSLLATGGIYWRKDIIGDYLYLEKVE